MRVLNSQASHTYGVIDPLLIERRDTKFLGGSLADACNVVMLPQGGYSDRGGTDKISRVRRALTPVSITAGMVSGPGTAANLVDGNSATIYSAAITAADPFTVFTLSFTEMTAVAAVDLVNFSCSTGTRDNCVKVQWKDADNVFHDFCPPFHIRTTDRRRRFAQSPGDGNVMTSQIRMLVTGGNAIGTINIKDIKLWVESVAATDAVVRSFNHSAGLNYQLVMSDDSLDIYLNGVWQTAVPVAWTSAQVRRVKRETDYDTALFYHQAFKTKRLVRAGSDREWNIDEAPYEDLPLVDYGGNYTNGVDEVQRVTFTGLATGDRFQLILNGEKTNEITFSDTPATLAANIKAALEEIPGVDPGLTVTATATQALVTFSGGANAGRDWPEMEALVFNNNDYISVGTKTKGKKPGEAIMSSSRGWPAVGRFTQERHVVGGVAARGGTYLASVPGNVFSYNTELQGAASAMVYDIAGEDNVIRDFYVGRTLLIFTPSSVWHLATPKLSAEEVPALLKSDAPGITDNLPPLSLSNSIFYVQRGGQTLVQLNYSELEQNFIGDNASVLSAFLVNNPIDWTLRRSTDSNDADLLAYINQDGKLVTLTLMRAQEVSGFAPHKTQGQFVSLTTDGEQNVWLICRRTVAGTTELFLERMQPDKQLDCGTDFVFEQPSSILGGLDDYAGQSLHVYGDGQWLGCFDVSQDHIELPRSVTTARVGYWTAPYAVDTPFHPEEDLKRPLARLKRVFGTELSLLETDAVALSVNGGPVTPLTINSSFTGTQESEGWPGFTRDGQVTVTQTRPGRLKVRSLRKKIAA